MTATKLPVIVDFKQAKPILDSINWSFSSPFSVGRSGIKLFDCRKYHWYPATFIPEIPYALIEVLTEPGAVVYDPFGGIGTTLFQSLLLGRVPFTSEICRVTIDFMRSLWVLFSPQTEIREILSDIKEIKEEYDSNKDYARCMANSTVLVEQLRPWYPEKTFNQLMYLAFYEMNCESLGTRAAARIALSATLKAVCAQDRGWGCIADNMLPKPKQLEKERDAIQRFTRNVTVLTRDIQEVKSALPASAHHLLSLAERYVHIAQSDVRKVTVPGDETVDLIVTSPPYPNMTDYTTSQRLSYYWMGGDPKDDLIAEIGARRKRTNPASIKKYTEEMKEATQRFASKLKLGGYICFIMPSFNSDKYNNTIRKQAIQECLAYLFTQGFVLEHEVDRIIPSRRRQHNQMWTSLEKETISIYRKIQ